MQLFVMVLNKEELLEDVLTLFVEIGVSGATIIDSVGMGRILAQNIPIFTGFKDLLQGNRPHNKTIFAVVSDKLAKELPEWLKRAFAKEEDKGMIYFLIPINKAWGIREEG